MLMNPVRIPQEDVVQCSYCGQKGDRFLVRCCEVNCGLYFCNGCNTQENSPGKPDSHIISHQRISDHHRIAVYHRQDHNGPEAAPTFEHDQKYYTFGCILHLRPVNYDHVHSPTENGHYDTRSEEDRWFCELRQIEWKRYRSGTKLLPMVERTHPTYKHFNLRLALVPTKSDQKGCNLMLWKNIKAQERAWFLEKCGLAPLLNNPAVLSAPVYSFMNEREYNEHFRHLLYVDKMVSQTITLIDWNRGDGTPINWLDFESTLDNHKKKLPQLYEEGKTVQLLVARLNAPVPVHIISIRNRKDTMIFRVVLEDNSIQEEDLNGRFGIHIAYEDTRYERQLDALKHFTTDTNFHRCQNHIFRFILGTRKGELQPSYEHDWRDPRDPPRRLASSEQTLNEYQENAVRMALSKPISLIQGPPGTGKTHTLAAIVRNVFEQRSGGRRPKVLCCAPSNVPTDNIALRLAEDFRLTVLRISSRKDQARTVSEASLKLTLHYRVQHELRNMDPKKDEEAYRMAWNDEARKLIKHCDIICTTCNAAGCGNLKGVSFSDVFIDEATQASELDALIAITKARTRVVLIGDERQLAVPKNIRFPELDHSNLVISIFERMIHLKQVPRVMLEMQYRMHKTICDPVSRVIYDERLKTELSVCQLRHCNKLSFIHPRPGSGRRSQVIWIDSAKAHQTVADGVSYINRQEADIILRVIMELVRQKVAPKDIGVITFYSAQKAFLRDDILAEFVKEGLVVDTVDHFQGGEMDYILLSCVRSGKASGGAVGFLDEVRRMTVALTRAKKGLVIVGNRELLEAAEKHWKEIIEQYPVVVEMGMMTVNALSPGQAYVRVQGKENDINIDGSRDRGGAMNGDLVMVEVHPQDQWKIRLEAIEEIQAFLKIPDLGDCVSGQDIEFLQKNKRPPARSTINRGRDLYEVVESPGRVWMDVVNRCMDAAQILPEWLQRTGKVVSIMSKEGNRNFVGLVVEMQRNAVNWNDTAFVLEPIDPRMPRAEIRLEDVPEAIRNRLRDTADVDLKHELFHATFTGHRCTESGTTIHLGRITNINDRGAGRPGLAMFHTKNILVENGIQPVQFPANQVQDVIEKAAARHVAEAKSSFEDFRDQLVFTIDPPGASDLDDAVSYKVLTDGTLEIGVHIADVTSFVEAGSDLDRDLRGRGSSVYMLDKVVHMMPRALMEQCSLIRHEERRVVSVVHTFSPSGEDLGYRITRGRIRSCAQLTYMDAEDIIKKGCLSACLSDFGDEASEICEAIVSVNRIAQILRAKRLAGGARVINPEKIRYGRGDGGRSVMVQEESLESNQLIEELALLTNSVAAWEIQKAFPNFALLRRQQPPRADVLSKLVRLCDQEKLQLSFYAQQSLPALLEEVLASRPDLHPVLQAQSQDENPTIPAGLTPEIMNDIAGDCNVANAAAKTCSAASQSLYMGLHLMDEYGGSSRQMGTVVAVYAASRAVEILAPQLGVTMRVFCREQAGLARISHHVTNGRQLLELGWDYEGREDVDQLGIGSQIEVDVGLIGDNVRLIKITITPPHLRNLISAPSSDHSNEAEPHFEDHAQTEYGLHA
ncbi:Regulator of nonsense transcripts 1-like protein [Hypsibius exemplaris]|uniref:Regulator of nonsense transcripts 1-like protein n=1 Tax=Hypsibius exemplaris TaxID=2072580 RepID=A0A1W0WN61_HYPEX|nr:Regulator of nonsense transcripts 1-like protein [Hypsibius exemplaris]